MGISSQLPTATKGVLLSQDRGEPAAFSSAVTRLGTPVAEIPAATSRINSLRFILSPFRLSGHQPNFPHPFQSAAHPSKRRSRVTRRAESAARHSCPEPARNPRATRSLATLGVPAALRRKPLATLGLACHNERSRNRPKRRNGFLPNSETTVGRSQRIATHREDPCSYSCSAGCGIALRHLA